MDPHTLETRPGPETLGGFLHSGIAPSTTGSDALDKAIGLGKACTAHPHVVHGEGISDRLAIFSWQRYVYLGTYLSFHGRWFGYFFISLCCGRGNFLGSILSLHPHAWEGICDRLAVMSWQSCAMCAS